MTAVFFITLIFLIPGIGCGIWAALEWRTQKKLAEQGIATEAKVIDRRITSSRGSKMYSVTSRYWHEGESYERRSMVSKEKYDGLAIGKRVSIRYLPDAPWVARMEGERIFFSSALMSIVLVWLALVFFIIVLTTSQHH